MSGAGNWPATNTSPVSTNLINQSGTSDIVIALMPRLASSSMYSSIQGVYQFVRFDKVIYRFSAMTSLSTNAPSGANTTTVGGVHVAVAGTNTASWADFPSGVTTTTTFPSYPELIDLPKVRKIRATRSFTVTIRPKLLKYAVTAVSGGVISGDLFDYVYMPFGKVDTNTNTTSAFTYGALVTFQSVAGSTQGYQYGVESEFHYTMFNPS